MPRNLTAGTLSRSAQSPGGRSDSSRSMKPTQLGGGAAPLGGCGAGPASSSQKDPSPHTAVVPNFLGPVCRAWPQHSCVIGRGPPRGWAGLRALPFTSGDPHSPAASSSLLSELLHFTVLEAGVCRMFLTRSNYILLILI